MSSRFRVVGILALMAVGVGSACSDGTATDAESNDGDGQSAATPAQGPEGDQFYLPPDPLPSGEPGDLIWATPVAGQTGTKRWRILYLSTTVEGEPKAVSGLLVAPDPLPDTRPLPILAFAHGATGLADECAPSKEAEVEPESVGAMELPTDMLSNYVVVATDYEGLGTPGVHPYAVNLAAGRDLLDSIRVAQRFGGVGTNAESDSQVWGHSQGGGAALFAAELASSYAPDANLAGAVAGAPAAELKLMASALRGSPYFGLMFMGGAGYQAAYPALDLAAAFTPEGIAAAEQAAEVCFDEAIDARRGQDPDRLLHADPGTVEPFASLLEDNSPGVRSTDVPIFLYQGEADEQVPVIASELLLDRYCENGTPAYRKTWPGADHNGVVPLAIPDIQTFMAERIEGLPAPTSC